ncbi:MAG TPA: pyridoxamine 5'-phosphate oxidase family protein [Actinomycetota bacterium]|nr:pyridoxamine 5'-phosphate oxidase family protein [Actinomycetota bacterium]
MTWQEFLNERPIAVIATPRADGTPHAVPVEVLVRDGKVYVWSQATSQKARNAARARRAGLVGYKGHSFVSIRGPVNIISIGVPIYDEITRGFLDKYEREESYGNDTLIEITPEHVASDRI